IFSAPGLKIHAKLFLISRKENGEVVRYAHIGTGNFNEKTARHCLFTQHIIWPQAVRQMHPLFQAANNLHGTIYHTG
ncbi:hypothetical protein IBK38_27355, partial [Escherichia coli]|nr:hypothetical protein [Escherichia coli]